MDTYLMWLLTSYSLLLTDGESLTKGQESLFFQAKDVGVNPFNPEVNVTLSPKDFYSSQRDRSVSIFSTILKEANR